MPDDPRKTALLILGTLEKTGNTLDRVLEQALQERSFPRRDTALLHALVFGVLRWRGRIDHVITRFSRTPLSKIDPEVRNILRMGLFQILFLDRIPASAAVNTSVEMVKASAVPRAAGFVNAVLRNALRKADDFLFPDPEKDPVEGISVRKSFPRWLIKRWLDRFGREETESLCDAMNAIPPITVRANTLKAGRDALFPLLSEEAERVDASSLAPDGIHLFSPKRPIPEMETFRKGFFQVQGEAGQLVSFVLDPRPGDDVLDACAGQGGKTGHLAQRMENRGRLAASDVDEARLSRLRLETDRLGITIARTIRADLNHRLPEDLGTFHRVLLDAPCSGLGVIQRNPDIKWASGKSDLGRYAAQQSIFLENVAPRVRPSGILVYAVCSMEPEETEGVVKTFLNKHPEFVIDGFPLEKYPFLGPVSDREGFLRTFPHRHRMEGFFAARLRRV